MSNDEHMKVLAPLACGCVAVTVMISNVLHTLTATALAEKLRMTRVHLLILRSCRRRLIVPLQIPGAEQKRVKAIFSHFQARTAEMRQSFVNDYDYYWNDVLWEKIEELTDIERYTHGADADLGAAARRCDFVCIRSFAGKALPVDMAELEADSRRALCNLMSALTRDLAELSQKSLRHLCGAIDEASDQLRAVDVEQIFRELSPSAWKRSAVAWLKSRVGSEVSFGMVCSMLLPHLHLFRGGPGNFLKISHENGHFALKL